MIKKQEIINVLIDYGLSVIESDRALDSVEEFECCIKDIIEKIELEFIDKEYKNKIKKLKKSLHLGLEHYEICEGLVDKIIDDIFDSRNKTKMSKISSYNKKTTKNKEIGSSQSKEKGKQK